MLLKSFVNNDSAQEIIKEYISHNLVKLPLLKAPHLISQQSKPNHKSISLSGCLKPFQQQLFSEISEGKLCTKKHQSFAFQRDLQRQALNFYALAPNKGLQLPKGLLKIPSQSTQRRKVGEREHSKEKKE